MIEIKEITSGDIELVVDIIRKSFSEQARILGLSQELYPNYAAFETAERVWKALNAGECVLLAYVDELAIGSVRYSVDKKYPKKGYINRLTVIPEFRGNDYGKVFMEYAEKKLLEQGVEEIEISIVKQFTRLEKYYMKSGYRFLRDQMYQTLPFEVRFLTKSLIHK